MGQLQPAVPLLCMQRAHGFGMWTEGLPCPLKQNRAAVERACFQKCGLFPVCGMADTFKLRHLCAWPGVPARDLHDPQGHQQDTPETATLSLAQVLCGTAVKSWLPCTAGLVWDATRKMPCQVRQLLSPFPHPHLSPRLPDRLCSLKSQGFNSINSAPGSSAGPFHLKAPTDPLAPKVREL